MNITKASTTRKVLLIMIVFIMLMTIVTAVFAFQYFKSQKITSLSQRVTSFAVAIDADEINQLSGTEDDVENQSYQNLKGKLISLQEFNADTRFIYLMGQRESEIFFYADSEPDTSEDYSPPGQIYDEASDVIYAVFKEGAIGTEVSTDRWGTWLSVMAPVIDPITSETIALVGFDMPYQSFLTEVILFTLLPVSLGVIIFLLLIAAFFYAKKDEHILQIRSEYFAIAAHDLRTPLTGIKWAMSSLRKSKPLSEDTKYAGIVDQISLSTENMLLSVNELLEGSSIEKSGTKLVITRLDIGNLLKAASAPLTMSAKEKKITLAWQLAKKLFVHADNDKLRRVFANLISNAIKYSPDSSTVTIATEQKKDRVVIAIKDSGIGIPLNEQQNVFNGYFRASNAKTYTTQGTGLGLYYAKNIIELHGGEIGLQSEPEVGTTITMTLPLTE